MSEAELAALRDVVERLSHEEAHEAYSRFIFGRLEGTGDKDTPPRIHCSHCKKNKPAEEFDAGNLRRQWPNCRACVAEFNRRSRQRRQASCG